MLSQPRRVQRADGNAYDVTPATLRRYLLTGGLATCGVCGVPMTGIVRYRQAVPGKPKPEPKPYLSCHPIGG
jgi:hypothetical protein